MMLPVDNNSSLREPGSPEDRGHLLKAGGPGAGKCDSDEDESTVQFEITEVTRQSVERFLADRLHSDTDHLFPSRSLTLPHISTRQYARIMHPWIKSIGLDDRAFGTHSLRRTKVVQIYRKTRNLRAVQLLLGHAKIETTFRYLGVEVDDALHLSEQIEL
jgi:integrase